MIRLLLIVLYPLLIATRVVHWLRGGDPLRLREPRGSCWIERGDTPPARRYFLERDGAGRDRLVIRILSALANAVAARRTPSPAMSRPAPLASDIPDEVYTLW